MNINDSLIITETISIENGSIPCGAVMKINDISKVDDSYLVSITPFIFNNIRTTKQMKVNLNFIKKYTTK